MTGTSEKPRSSAGLFFMPEIKKMGLSNSCKAPSEMRSKCLLFIDTHPEKPLIISSIR
jgi:hypothetical protein